MEENGREWKRMEENGREQERRREERSAQKGGDCAQGLYVLGCVVWFLKCAQVEHGLINSCLNMHPLSHLSQVRDIWQAKDMGTTVGEYSTTVPSQATAYLTLTPA